MVAAAATELVEDEAAAILGDAAKVVEGGAAGPAAELEGDIVAQYCEADVAADMPR